MSFRHDMRWSALICVCLLAWAGVAPAASPAVTVQAKPAATPKVTAAGVAPAPPVAPAATQQVVPLAVPKAHSGTVPPVTPTPPAAPAGASAKTAPAPTTSASKPAAVPAAATKPAATKPAATPALKAVPVGGVKVTGVLREVTLDVSSIDGQQLDPGRAFWAMPEQRFYLISESSENETFAGQLGKPAVAVLRLLAPEVKTEGPATIHEYEIIDLKPLSGKDAEAVKADAARTKPDQDAAVKRLSADMGEYMKTIMEEMSNDEASMTVDLEEDPEP
jgi:hypothetical protein